MQSGGGGLLRQVSNGSASMASSAPTSTSQSLLMISEPSSQSQSQERDEEIPPIWTPPGVPPSPKSQRKFRPVQFNASPSSTLSAGANANSNANTQVPSSPISSTVPMSMPRENGGNVHIQQPISSSPMSMSMPIIPRQQAQVQGSGSGQNSMQMQQFSSSQQYFQYQQSKFQSTSSSTTTSANSSLATATSPPNTNTNANASLKQTSLPRYPSPTVTLLQKAREGQLPKGAAYLEQQTQNQHQHQVEDKRNGGGEIPSHSHLQYNIQQPLLQIQDQPKIPQQTQFNPAYAIRSYADGVIPPGLELRRSQSAQNASGGGGGGGLQERIDIPMTSKYSLPGEKEQREWYRKMYESLHVEKKREIANKKCTYPAGKIKAAPPAKSFWPKKMHSSGAQSEPEDDLCYLGGGGGQGEEEYDFNKFGNKVLSPTYTAASPGDSKTPPGAIRFTPGRIEDYNPTTGAQTSNTRKQRYFRQNQPDLKKHWALVSSPISSGYESDSNYIIRKRSEIVEEQEPPPPPLSPAEQRQLYLDIQKGGEVPLQGLRKLVGPHHNNVQDEFRTTSPSANLRYNESTVNIHYRAPVRIEEKEFVAEEELRRRQQLAMKKFYEEQRKLKYLREIEDMESRRHSDNFVPSQKSPIPLNRYEEGEDYDGLVDNRPPRPSSSGLWQRMTPEPQTPTGTGSGRNVGGKSLNLLAKALYNFTAQSPRELELVKGDVVVIRRKIDGNWYEGELRHATGSKAVFTYSSSSSALGIFPASYVQILSEDSLSSSTLGLKQGRLSEGLARVLYNFRPSTPLELQLSKGEMVLLTRRIDGNWFEGRRQKGPTQLGIFPVSYVDVVREIGASGAGGGKSPKPVGQPVAHSLNYSSNDRHHYKPNEFVLQDETMSDYGDVFSPGPGPGLGPRSPRSGIKSPPNQNKNERNRRKMNQRLELITIDTRLNNDQPFRYRAIYNYKPVHKDELELGEDDIIEVLEKCDDGWFVGTSTRTGLFGTFPGNYVERIN